MTTISPFKGLPPVWLENQSKRKSEEDSTIEEMRIQQLKNTEKRLAVIFSYLRRMKDESRDLFDALTYRCQRQKKLKPTVEKNRLAEKGLKSTWLFKNKRVDADVMDVWEIIFANEQIMLKQDRLAKKSHSGVEEKNRIVNRRKVDCKVKDTEGSDTYAETVEESDDGGTREVFEAEELMFSLEL